MNRKKISKLKMPFNRRLIICHKPLTSLKISTIGLKKPIVNKKKKAKKKVKINKIKNKKATKQVKVKDKKLLKVKVKSGKKTTKVKKHTNKKKSKVKGKKLTISPIISKGLGFGTPSTFKELK